MKLIRIFAAALLTAATALGARATTLYATGGFNGWDVKVPAQFAQGDDGGIFSLDIDFSSSREFKMSTATGAGSAGNGWTEFDAGALKPVADCAIGQWTAITANPSGNIIAPDARLLTMEVDLAAMRMRFVRAAEYSGTLPVLYIDTEGGAPVTSKEDYLQATYRLDPLGLPGYEAFGTADAPLPLQIRGRGNYTWSGFDKKPYRIKLGSKSALLGMKKSKHFVLLAHADDTLGFMRNTLGFATSRHAGLAWTPAQRPVEVVLNGDYIGLYFLTENIRVDEDRVDVVEQADMATTDVDGGWLVEIDNYDTDPHVTVYEGSYPVWFTYKSPEVLSTEQSTFLQSQMQAIQDAIAAADYAAFTALVDPDMLARYYMVQEVMNDYESFHGSCYLYRRRGAAERWMFGPVWDFGSALFRDGDNRFIYDSEYHQVWIGTICSAFPQFNDAVKGVWRQFLADGAPEAIVAEGEALAAEISAAAAANYRRWPQYGNADEAASAATAFSRLRSKVEWLRTQWVSGGIADASTTSALRVYTSGGALCIEAAEACTVAVASPDGIVRRISLHPGLNTVTTLPRGFYIVEGRKIAL